MPFPAPAHTFPTKDDMADYLEAYAARFQLPVRSGVTVDCLSKPGERFVLTAGSSRFEAENVVVAMSNWQRPKLPTFSRELNPDIVQLHSSEYRNPSQLKHGAVLIVGAGNSGAEIAVDLAPYHRVWMSGNDTGHVPFRIEGAAARYLLIRLVLRVLFHRVLTVKTPIGRKLRGKLLSHGMPLLRTRPRDLASAGIERLPRTVSVRDGRPVLADGRILEVANVIWCTGFRTGLSWIDLSVIRDEQPMHDGGIVAEEPGLYFVGLSFLYAASSSMIHGVGRDAKRIADALAKRSDANALRADKEQAALARVT
jgi:putative flavoprotein involved in K+ transport